jgi:hypothetical protein
MYNVSLQGSRPGDRFLVEVEFSGPIHNCLRGQTIILYKGYRDFLGVKAAGIYNYLINCTTGTFPFNVPAIEIVNNSSNLTQTSVSFPSSQHLFTFCSPGQYKLNTHEQSPSLRKMKVLTATHNKFVPNGL